MKRYSICVEKDLNMICDAQLLVDMVKNGWTLTDNENKNPCMVTVFNMFTIECDDIEYYKDIIYNYNPDNTLRILECTEI